MKEGSCVAVGEQCEEKWNCKLCHCGCLRVSREVRFFLFAMSLLRFEDVGFGKCLNLVGLSRIY